MKVKAISKERYSLLSKIKAKVLLDLETLRTMFHERLKIYLAKSDIITKRNTSVTIFLLLKAIRKIEDSTEENAKNNNKKKQKEVVRTTTDPYQQVLTKLPRSKCNKSFYARIFGLGKIITKQRTFICTFSK